MNWNPSGSSPRILSMILSGILLTGCQKAPQKVNMLFILTDQWRGSALGYAGDPNVRTPELDRFASQSTVFTNAVSVCPVCTPYRAALLTGRYPTSTGMFLNDAYLPPEELCLAEIFKENGYQTGYIGKWHLDGHGRLDFTPPQRRQGFDYWKALECSHDYNNMPYYEGESPEIKYWKGYSADAVVEDAIKYLNSHANDKNPFFLMVSLAGPHFPHHTAPERFKAEYPAESLQLAPNVPPEKHDIVRKELVGYYAHCTAIDLAIGRLLKATEQLDLKNRTVIVFTSDHGEIMGAHGIRETQKQVPFIESAGVPLIISRPYKNRILKGSISTPLTTPDLSATLLDLCRLPIPDSFEGESFADIIQDPPAIEADPFKGSLFMSVVPFASVHKDFKREYRALKTTQYTFVISIDGPWLMFDDLNDPYQMNNLVQDPDHESVLSKLDEQLKAELERIGDEFKPAGHYLTEWGFTVTDGGYIRYEAHNQTPQAPKRR